MTHEQDKPLPTGAKVWMIGTILIFTIGSGISFFTTTSAKEFSESVGILFMMSIFWPVLLLIACLMWVVIGVENLLQFMWRLFHG